MSMTASVSTTDGVAWSTSPRPESRIEAALNRLDETVSKAHASVGEAINRIDVVLQPEAPTMVDPGDAMKSDPPKSSIVRRIESTTRDVESLIAHLQRAMDRLDT